MKIGVFGGTFNPIHFGHLRAAEEAREILGLDKVLFIPSGNPPLKTRHLAYAADRYKMAQMATEGNNCFEVSDIECSDTEKSYTVNTLSTLREVYKNAELFFMLGTDAFLDLPNWWRPEELISLADLVVLSRPGISFAALASSPYLTMDKKALQEFDTGKARFCRAPLKTSREAVLTKVLPMPFSSTDIRNRISAGKSIKYLLPAQIESFIISNKLYNNETAGRRG